MNKEKITSFDLVESAGDLYRLTTALEMFVIDRCSDIDSITLKDLNGLMGLAKALSTTADKHVLDASAFDSGL